MYFLIENFKNQRLRWGVKTVLKNSSFIRKLLFSWTLTQFLQIGSSFAVLDEFCSFFPSQKLLSYVCWNWLRSDNFLFQQVDWNFWKRITVHCVNHKFIADSPRMATPPVDLGGAKVGLGTVGILRGWFDARDVAKSTGWLCSGIWGPPPGPTPPGGGGYPPWLLPWFDINARWISGEINNFILSGFIFLLSKFLKSSVVLFHSDCLMTFWVFVLTHGNFSRGFYKYKLISVCF